MAQQERETRSFMKEYGVVSFSVVQEDEMWKTCKDTKAGRVICLRSGDELLPSVQSLRTRRLGRRVGVVDIFAFMDGGHEVDILRSTRESHCLRICKTSSGGEVIVFRALI